jgi:hypothetical protein
MAGERPEAKKSLIPEAMAGEEVYTHRLAGKAVQEWERSSCVFHGQSAFGRAELFDRTAFYDATSERAARAKE